MRLFEVFAFKRRHCLNPLSWVWRDRNIEQGSKAFIQAVGSNNDGLVSEEEYKKSIHPYLIRSHILSETCCQPKSMSEELQNFSSFNGTAAQFKDINAFFREVDTNTDGQISELELQAWILNNMTCQSFMKRMFSNAQSIDEGCLGAATHCAAPPGAVHDVALYGPCRPVRECALWLTHDKILFRT